MDYARLIHSAAFRRLQGKTQLFPGESDFFRNRLTHSIEVAQIAEGIAAKINYEHFREVEPDPTQHISTDLVQFAALAHDLGHPPFGHNGEAALDECMCEYGGFEGNAQTLRILGRLEKKRTAQLETPVEFADGQDLRCGLNLTYRSLASVLKYDRSIQHRCKGSQLKKGYYLEEATLVGRLKQGVLGDFHLKGEFKTIECQIMDIADDIAYSTYDFEDSLKAGFTSLLDLPSIGEQQKLLGRVAVKVWKRLNKRTYEIDENNIPDEIAPAIEKTKEDVAKLLVEQVLGVVPEITGTGLIRDVRLVGRAFQTARAIARNGYLRTSLTSQMVAKFIRGISFTYNPDCPPLSAVEFRKDKPHLMLIEALKHYTYEAHIENARLKTVEFRGKDIVTDIFSCLKEDHRNMLLPEDYRQRCEGINDENHRLRCICDFVAGMTDRYALEFYNRLKSGESTTIFKEF